VIDEMRGTFGHAATTATGTERPPLARERDEPIEAAAAAVKPRKAAGQEPAPEERPERPLDKLRHAFAVAQTGRLHQEGLQVVLHDLVEDASVWTTWFVARARPGHPAREAEGVPTVELPPFGGIR
jgi:hypothetical protein